MTQSAIKSTQTKNEEKGAVQDQSIYSQTKLPERSTDERSLPGQKRGFNLLNPRGGRSMRNCNTESAHTATCVLVGTATCLISRHTARLRAARSSGYVRKLSGRLD
jgi:hypothetical protein